MMPSLLDVLVFPSRRLSRVSTPDCPPSTIGRQFNPTMGIDLPTRAGKWLEVTSVRRDQGSGGSNVDKLVDF